MNQHFCILIADDQQRARQSLRAVITAWLPTVQVVEAETGEGAIRLAQEARPEIVILDARMPDMDGIAATRALKEQFPAVRVIILSIYPEYRDAALAAGVDAFLLKTDPPGKLRDALARMAGVDRSAG